MIQDEFEYFIRTTYPTEFEKRNGRFPKSPLKNLWPEHWQAFQYMNNKFMELINENSRVERDRNACRDRADVYKERIVQAQSLLRHHFTIRLGDSQTTLKAIERSLLGDGCESNFNPLG